MAAQQILNAALKQARTDLGEAPSDGAADVKMFEAKVAEQAVCNLQTARHHLGQAVLAGLWAIYQNEYFTQLGEYNTLHEWIAGKFGDTQENQYIHDLGLIVIRVFPKVQSRLVAGNPFKLEDGTPIGVDTLIETPGLVGKFKQMSSVFEEVSHKPELQESLIRGAVTKTRVDFVEDIARASGKEVIRIPFQATSMPDHRYRVEMELDEKQFFTLRALLGKSAMESIA